MITPNIQEKDAIHSSMRAQLMTSPQSRHPETRRRLKVGLLSSDFGVHPVATLIRSFVQFVDTSKFELYCFALTDKRSWWGLNISNTVEHFVNLAATNTQDAAMEIALEKIDILIDLNGGTLNSGVYDIQHISFLFWDADIDLCSLMVCIDPQGLV
jgi:predicted O-linked N-acetylglucosamine transferase (SPINDLY family)